MKNQPHTAPTAEQFSTIPQAAKRLNSTPATLHTWRKKGWLLAKELQNGRFLVSESEILRLGLKAGEA